MQHRQQFSNPLRWHDLKCCAVAFRAAMRLSQIGAWTALEREVGEVHTSFFADLQCGESQVDVERQALATGLVEDRLPRVQIGHFAESPHEFLVPGTGSDGVAQGNPAPARDLIHDEGVALLAEQQALVARERCIGDR